MLSAPIVSSERPNGHGTISKSTACSCSAAKIASNDSPCLRLIGREPETSAARVTARSLSSPVGFIPRIKDQGFGVEPAFAGRKRRRCSCRLEASRREPATRVTVSRAVIAAAGPIRDFSNICIDASTSRSRSLDSDPLLMIPVPVCYSARELPCP